MENTTKKTEKKAILPYNVDKAFIGLGLKDTDNYTLNYLNFFSTQIPITNAYFLHVLPKYNLLSTPNKKEIQIHVSGDTTSDDKRNEMQAEVKSMLANWDKVNIEYDIMEGDPLEEMMKNIDALNPDLLVIGQKKGRSPHGIFAKNLARNTYTDVLIIPETSKESISTILVPIDFSENSIKALESALAIQQQLTKPARFFCLHIYNMPNSNYFRNEKPSNETKAIVESNLNNAFNVFLNTIAPEYKNQIEIALIERQTTDTASFIMDFAKDNLVDFMVIGSRGHSQVHLLLMGSVTESVLDINESIPTLIVC